MAQIPPVLVAAEPADHRAAGVVPADGVAGAGGVGLPESQLHRHQRHGVPGLGRRRLLGVHRREAPLDPVRHLSVR
ncbi:hypothetical protein G6F68_021851 [Rhizopus microsporus]|nr:hypothetical protein G6F68_021851 [Rhizopus microsporus]